DKELRRRLVRGRRGRGLGRGPCPQPESRDASGEPGAGEEGTSGAAQPEQPPGAGRMDRCRRHRSQHVPLGHRPRPSAGYLRCGGCLLMLSPDDQLLPTDALRPPAGFDVECAVATTYSLTVESVLVAPMSFAMSHGDVLPEGSQGDTVG